jgi:hypothetical protein
VPLDISQLGSIASSLEELTERLGRIRREGDSDDELMVDLNEVERQLNTASRRLNKSLRGHNRRTR